MSREIGPEEARIAAHFAAVQADLAALEQGRKHQEREEAADERNHP